MASPAFNHLDLASVAGRTETSFSFFIGMTRAAIDDKVERSGQAVVFDDRIQTREEVIQQVAVALRRTLNEAVEVYCRQMVVVWASLVEASIEHYLMVVFSRYPERMALSLPKKEGRPTSPHPSYAARVIRSLPHGRMKAALRRASAGRLDGFDFHMVDEVNCRRNEIVHDWSQEHISRDQLDAYYKSVRGLIDAFADACRADGITVRDINYFDEHPEELTL